MKTFISRLIIAPLALLASAALTLTAPRPAQACGGLFCSQSSPVNQAAERIVFSFDRAQQKVTAVVEILYQGPSEKFAWVLPVPGIPEIGVSNSLLLDRLQAQTNPTYSLQRSWEGKNCGGLDGNRSSVGSAAPPGVSAPLPPGPGGGPMVTVLSAGSVGPYNYEVIQVDPADSDPADVAIEWLKANGYDVGALGPDVLRPYLRDKLNLVAFRLSKNRNAGSIRPVMLTYKSDRPMIPIRPTAVAANDDMGILVWVLGASRAVPSNFKTLELNEAILDWFNPGTSYNGVVTAAAEEADGQGFVTELARPLTGSGIADSLLPEQTLIEQFRRAADTLAAPQLIVQVVDTFSMFGGGGGGFPGRPMVGSNQNSRIAVDGVSDVLAKHLQLPAGVTVDQFLAAPRCYFQTFRTPGSFYCDGKPVPAGTVDLAGFDRNAFLADLEALVIGPLEKTVQLFRDQRYMTRLYTTMSARDMTLDPEFDLNQQLPDVSNFHTAALKYLDACPGEASGRWEATLESGQVVPGRDGNWPFSPQTARMPANLRILQLSATGAERVVTDNRGNISGQLRALAHPSGGCALSTSTDQLNLGGAALLALALAALVGRRALRRR